MNFRKLTVLKILREVFKTLSLYFFVLRMASLHLGLICQGPFSAVCREDSSSHRFFECNLTRSSCWNISFLKFSIVKSYSDCQKNVLKHRKMSKMSKYVQIYPNVSKCVQIYQNLSKCIKICQDVSKK